MNLKKLPWKPFLISFVAVFLMVAIPKLTPQSDPLVSPQSDTVRAIFQKLRLVSNNYQLKQPNSLITTTQAAGPYTEAAAYAAINYETGEIIESKNLDQSLPIASLTKIMTVVVALDLASPNQRFTVSDHAASIIPTKIGVVPGQKLTLQELVNAALLTSANDAVEVIKEGIDQEYGAGTFVEGMNEKAKFLNLSHSSFTNPQGFDNRNHYSSIHDLAILTHYAMTNYPLIAETAQKSYQFLPADDYHKQYDLYNWNGLIGTYPETIGLKIGNTGRAKMTTAVVSNRNQQKVMVIVLGAPGVLERDLWASQLLDSAYSQIANLPPINLTEAELRAKYATWQYWE